MIQTDKVYDVAIVGGGPAGLTAAIYSSRARMNTILLEKAFCGGQILTVDTIENFPGFPDGVKGPDLAELLIKQAENFGIKIKTAEVKSITLKKEHKKPFTLFLNDNEIVHALSVIIATGAHWKTLGIPGEEEYKGKGVSYCATCDGPLFRMKDVMVIGGGDTALEDALFLTKFAKKVIVVHRRDALRATKILQERAYANDKIKFYLNSVATEIIGEKIVKSVRIKNNSTQNEEIVKCDGIFVLIGIKPNSDMVNMILKADDHGYIVSDEELATSVDGIFVCGDVRKKALKQIVTATGDGAIAAVSAEHYIARLKGAEYK